MSKIVSIIKGTAFTTSLSIADGTEVQHKNVMELVRRFMADLERFGGVAFETRKGEPLPHGGFARSTEVAYLNERQATLLMTYMRNSEIVRNFKIRLVEAFYELAQNPLGSMKRSELLKIALESEEKREALEAANRDMVPKVAALDRLTRCEGAVCITNAAKDLKMRPKDLFAWLSQNRWIYRRAGGRHWIGYQDKIQAGLIEHKVATIERDNAPDKAVEQVVITPKGLSALAQRMGTEAAA